MIRERRVLHSSFGWGTVVEDSKATSWQLRRVPMVRVAFDDDAMQITVPERSLHFGPLPRDVMRKLLRPLAPPRQPDRAPEWV